MRSGKNRRRQGSSRVRGGSAELVVSPQVDLPTQSPSDDLLVGTSAQLHASFEAAASAGGDMACAPPSLLAALFDAVMAVDLVSADASAGDLVPQTMKSPKHKCLCGCGRAGVIRVNPNRPDLDTWLKVVIPTEEKRYNILLHWSDMKMRGLVVDRRIAREHFQPAVLERDCDFDAVGRPRKQPRVTTAPTFRATEDGGLTSEQCTRVHLVCDTLISANTRS